MSHVKVFELMHGIVLTKILRSGGAALRLVETDTQGAWAAYTINDAEIVYVKYALSPRRSRRGEKTTWLFTIQPAELEKIRHLRSTKPVYFALVCGLQEATSPDMQVCYIPPDKLERCIDIAGTQPQSISVESTPNNSLRAYGPMNSSERDKLVINRNALDNWRPSGS